MLKTGLKFLAGLAIAASPPASAAAEPLIYGLRLPQFEYRALNGEDILAWDGTALVGSDEVKLVLRSEGELGLNSNDLNKLQNQLRVQVPIGRFFDALAGVYADTPKDAPDRYAGVIGVAGLAPQWFEIEASAFVSERPFLRFEADYSALITNWVTLTPNVKIDLPLRDDPAKDISAGGARLEIGARVSYDLIDRVFSPYVGVNYERVFGGTADRVRAAGDSPDAFAVVIGARMLF